ncbi:hypothetical protein BVRB_1g003440 [Beta vulgaris subsp. vulgaris]|nr:hypothetical protein BVRB_1g003440 [Beta vulgaris subsp. vulgaris]
MEAHYRVSPTNLTDGSSLNIEDYRASQNMCSGLKTIGLIGSCNGLLCFISHGDYLFWKKIFYTALYKTDIVHRHLHRIAFPRLLRSQGCFISGASRFNFVYDACVMKFKKIKVLEFSFNFFFYRSSLW